jgi:uncharacterized protein YgiM (DUF1202 family)
LIATGFIPAHFPVRVGVLVSRSAEAGVAMLTLLPVLKFLIWPLTLVVAVLAFSLSSQSVFTLVAEHAKVSSVALKRAVDPPVASKMMQPTPAVAVPTALATSPLHPHSAAATTAARKIAARPQMVVVADGLTVRAKAKKSSSVFGALRRNDTVEVLGSQGSWLLIRQGSITGWVSRKYLRTMEEASAN